ncbi:hypothetical protein IEC97_08255 [Neobacillus cucumis]|uniref:hypothetical protein n=1 Tax=Neobacillus cucumis TaxID=1740721 RepID=UPI0018DF3DE0|nr:hypothetical protein [Neobacillus cucumis]MBI0577351.1 hypothetical protein [Neobacillus cucumis]WHY94403.1 hypothetical protein QNK12_13425 [Neobacillus cucumis]
MFWIMVVLLFVIIIVFEEAASYFWKQYLFGPSNKSRRKWMMKALTFLRKKPQKEIRELKKEKSS